VKRQPVLALCRGNVIAASNCSARSDFNGTNQRPLRAELWAIVISASGATFKIAHESYRAFKYLQEPLGGDPNLRSGAPFVVRRCDEIRNAVQRDAL
jgi:hypothetical protein